MEAIEVCVDCVNGILDWWLSWGGDIPLPRFKSSEIFFALVDCFDHVSAPLGTSFLAVGEGASLWQVWQQNTPA